MTTTPITWQGLMPRLSDPHAWTLFCYIAMSAVTEPTQAWPGGNLAPVDLSPGQMIFKRPKAVEALCLSEQTIKTALKNLKSNQQITLNPTNKYTIITVLNWDSYPWSHNGANQQNLENQPTSNQQVTNKINSEKETSKASKPPKQPCPVEEIIELYNRMLPMLRPVKKALDEITLKALLARWSVKGQDNMIFWETYFRTVATLPHLRGENNRNWKASFKWLVGRDNMSKVSNDYYQTDDDRATSHKVRSVITENQKAKELALSLFGDEDDLDQE